MSLNKLSILSNVSTADIRLKPYPHIVVENALDADIYEQLAEQYPDPAVVMNGRERRDTWYDYPACYALNADHITPLWKEFMAYHISKDFYRDVILLLGDIINDCHPQIEAKFGKPLTEMGVDMRRPGTDHNLFNHQCDVSLECQLYINLTQDYRTIHGPHVDRTSELFAAMLYFRDSEDQSDGGHLQICRALDPTQMHSNERSVKLDHKPMEIDEAKVETVATAEYKANTLVFLLNSAKSLHSVSTRTPTSVPRRHVNFTADLYNLPGNGLFDYEF